MTSGRFRWQRVGGATGRAEIAADPDIALVALAPFAQADAT